MKIYKIAASYLIDRFCVTVFEYVDVKDTGKSLMFDGKRLSKENLGDINFEISGPRVVRSFVYIQSQDEIEKYKNLLHQKIMDELDDYQDKLLKTIKDASEWDGEHELKVVE